ncbi:MAG: hypothetical protein C4348_01085 [Patescibacteria group bacterium]
MLAGIHFFSASAFSISLTSSPYLAFLIGFLSHHFLDKLPHLDLNIFNSDKYGNVKNWDKKVWLLFFSEFLIFFLLTFYFLGKFDLSKQIIGFIGGLGGLFPDIVSFSLRSFFPKIKIFDFYLDFHKKFHFRLNKGKIFLPILFEILIIIFSIILFLGNY